MYCKCQITIKAGLLGHCHYVLNTQPRRNQERIAVIAKREVDSDLELGRERLGDESGVICM